MKKLVLQVEYGGLGDNLFYSAISKFFKDNNIYEYIYISNKSNFRNKEIKSLVWEKNPYIDGFTDLPGTDYFVSKKSPVDKIINMIAAQYGVIANFELDPYINDEFLAMEEYSESTYIDLNYSSYVGAVTILDKLIIAYKNFDAIIINPSMGMKILTSNRKIYTNSLNHYAQIIKSCKRFICLASGGATLSAALNKKAEVYYGYGQPTIFHHSTNENIMIGNKNLYRKLIAITLGYRNYIIRKVFNIK